MRHLVIGALLGGVGSLSISIGLIALFTTVGLIVLFVIASRSYAALSGALIGWGVVWLVVIGTGYLRCQSMGANCIGGENMLPFIAIAAMLLLAGAGVGALTVIRPRA